jgi:hypothetical protein
MTTETTHNEEVIVPEEGTGAAVPAGQEAAPQEGEKQPAATTKSIEDDEELQLKVLNKVLGTNYKTLDEAKPAPKKSTEEVEAEKADKERKALEWAVSSGKVSKEAIEKAAVLKAKSQRDIALDLFAQEFTEVTPNATEEEIKESFKDFYQEHLEDSSPTKAIAQKRMEKLVANYVKENTKSVDDIETEYEAHVSHEQRFGNFTSKVKEAIKAQPREFKISVPYTAEDGVEIMKEYSIPVDDKIIESVKKEFSNENVYYALGAHENDVDGKTLAEEISSTIELKLFKKGITEVFKQHAATVEKDVEARHRNIPVSGNTNNFIKNRPPEAPKKAIEHTFNRLASQGRLD